MAFIALIILVQTLRWWSPVHFYGKSRFKTAGGVFVAAAYSGVNARKVEEGISRKLKEAIDGLEGVERHRPVSNGGVSRAA